jgi:NADPH2:quinone reductase
MRAIVISKFGGPEVLELRELPKPSAGPGELLVRVIASGTNPVEAKIRAAGQWAQLPLPAVLGYDASGVVEAVGHGVTAFKPGDEVFFTAEIFGNARGTHAEYTVVSAAIVAPKPKELSHVEAAAIPLAGGTAWEAIVRRLDVRPGQTLLIHGGAGGVGSFAVQFARAAGARVIATASAENQDQLRALGADVCLDYRAVNVAEVALKETDGVGVDAVFDTAGVNIGSSTAATKPFGKLATILPPSGDLTALYTKNQSLHGVFLTRESARLRELAPLFASKRVRPQIAEVIPLEQVAKAHERLDSGHGRGKIVLQVSSS